MGFGSLPRLASAEESSFQFVQVRLSAEASHEYKENEDDGYNANEPEDHFSF